MGNSHAKRDRPDEGYDTASEGEEIEKEEERLRQLKRQRIELDKEINERSKQIAESKALIEQYQREKEEAMRQTAEIKKQTEACQKELAVFKLREQLNIFTIATVEEFQAMVKQLDRVEHASLNSSALPEYPIIRYRSDCEKDSDQSSAIDSPFRQDMLSSECSLTVYSTTIDKIDRDRVILDDIFQGDEKTMTRVLTESGKVLKDLRRLIRYGKEVLKVHIDDLQSLQAMLLYFLVDLVLVAELPYEVHAANDVPLTIKISQADSKDDKFETFMCTTDVAVYPISLTSSDIVNVHHIGELKANLNDPEKIEKSKDQLFGELLCVREAMKNVKTSTATVPTAIGYLTDMFHLYLVLHDEDQTFYIVEDDGFDSDPVDYVSQLLLLYCQSDMVKAMMKRNAAQVNTSEQEQVSEGTTRRYILRSSIQKADGGTADKGLITSDTLSEMSDPNLPWEDDCTVAEAYCDAIADLHMYVTKLYGNRQNYEPLSESGLQSLSSPSGKKK